MNFNVARNGQTIVRDAYAHSGDFMDISFELAYPEHAWLEENILRFWRNPNLPESTSDTLLVSNNSGRVIKYLKVNAGDMFLVFDLLPHSTLKVSPTHQSWGSWLKMEGQFIDGQKISGNGVNFFHRAKLDQPLRYCLSVTDNELKIESPQVAGYDTNGSAEKPNIPKASNCNP